MLSQNHMMAYYNVTVILYVSCADRKSKKDIGVGMGTSQTWSEIGFLKTAAIYLPEFGILQMSETL